MDYQQIVFVGSGALLQRALQFWHRRLSIPVLVILTGTDAIPPIRDFGFETYRGNPNKLLPTLLPTQLPNLIFSLNNRFVFTDATLEENWSFYNIHGAITESYRGFAEICVLAALLENNTKYGVTLHKVIPFQEVDQGPIVDVIDWPLTQKEDFSSLMMQVQKHCFQIFVDNVQAVLDGSVTHRIAVSTNQTESRLCGYSNVAEILAAAPCESLFSRTTLGPFVQHFPKLAQSIALEQSKRDGRCSCRQSHHVNWK